MSKLSEIKIVTYSAENVNQTTGVYRGNMITFDGNWVEGIIQSFEGGIANKYFVFGVEVPDIAMELIAIPINFKGKKIIFRGRMLINETIGNATKILNDFDFENDSANSELFKMKSIETVTSNNITDQIASVMKKMERFDLDMYFLIKRREIQLNYINSFLKGKKPLSDDKIMEF